MVGSDRKTGPPELDRTDRQIFTLLRDEGRRPNAEKFSYMWLPTEVHDAAGSTPADPAKQPAAKARSAEES